MKKIYLAISDHKGRDLLEKKANSIRDSNVAYLDSKEAVESVINNESFYMLFTSSSFITKDKLLTSTIQGILFIHDITKQMTTDEEKNIYVFDNIQNMITDALLMDLQNKELTQKLKENPEGNLPILEIKIENQKNEIVIHECPIENTIPNQNQDIEIQEVAAPLSTKEEKTEKSVIEKISLPGETIKSKDEKDYLYLLNRQLNIEKKSLLRRKSENNLMVGVWSPLRRIGVTSFVINFAIFLQQYKVNVSVLEGLNNNLLLKSLLTRYQSEPKNWCSFSDVLFSKDKKEIQARWVYKDVHWLPLGEHDSKREWNEYNLTLYFNNVGKDDYVFVDLPTGPMEDYTLDTLDYIDELWIMVDDSPDSILQWKKKIHEIILSKNIKSKLIFNHSFSKSRPEGISKLLELPLLAQIPHIHEEFVESKYDTKPLIDYYSAYRKLLPSYQKLAEQLLNEKNHKIKRPLKNWNLSKTLFQRLIPMKMK